ncbi:hypothetical protein VME0621_04127 [Vibrio mediterranei]|nr:hypothetical protein VME0621_04127 [Vibrio mediterranei]
MGFFIIGEVDLYAGFCIRRSGDSHSSRPAIAHWLEQPTRLHTRATQCGSLFGLAPGGVYLATNCYQSSGALLPHPFTLTCAPSEEMEPSAVFSLLHLSWAHAPQALPGTLLCGARTFLPSVSLPQDKLKGTSTKQRLSSQLQGADCSGARAITQGFLNPICIMRSFSGYKSLPSLPQLFSMAAL